MRLEVSERLAILKMSDSNLYCFFDFVIAPYEVMSGG